MNKIVYDVPDKEWDEYVESHPAGDLLQLSGWARTKAPQWSSGRVALRGADGQLVAGAQLLFRRLPLPGLKRYICYVPRGPLVDFQNAGLVTEFLDAMEAYAKKRGALSITLDPALRRDPWAESLLKLFGSRGYDHGGFTFEMTEIQPRFNMMLDIAQSEEDRRKGYSSSLRTKINRAARLPFVRKVCGPGELEDFFAVMEETGARDKIGVRTRAYYEGLLKAFEADGRQCFSVIYLSRQAALDFIREKYEQKPDDQLAKDIAFLEKETREEIPLACTAMLYCGKHAYYLYGGSSSRLRKTLPVFRLMPMSIDDAIARGAEIFDFGGVSGETDVKKDPRHGGLYMFKRLWGPEMVEYVGEFSRPLRPVMNKLFNAALGLRKKLRKSGRTDRQLQLGD